MLFHISISSRYYTCSQTSRFKKGIQHTPTSTIIMFDSITFIPPFPNIIAFSAWLYLHEHSSTFRHPEFLFWVDLVSEFDLRGHRRRVWWLCQPELGSYAMQRAVGIGCCSMLCVPHVVEAVSRGSPNSNVPNRDTTRKYGGLIMDRDSGRWELGISRWTAGIYLRRLTGWICVPL